MAYKYTFTAKYPPKMKDLKAPPVDIPHTDLEHTIGTAQWTKIEPPGGDFFEKIQGNRTVSFTLTRKRLWVMRDLHHYAQNVTEKVTTTTGYKRTEKKTFSDTFEIEASGKIWGWGAKVSNTLQITDEVEQEWHEEVVREVTKNFLANHWYVSWELQDLLYGTKTVTRDKPLNPPQTSHGQLSIITSLYDDDAADNEVRVSDAIAKLIKEDG